MIVDLLLAWEWQYDEPFVAMLRQSFAKRKLILLEVTPANLQRVLDGLSVGRYTVRAFWDRAADTNPAFLPLTRWAALNAPVRLNAFEQTRRAWIKTNMHWEFINAGINTPYTIPIPSFSRQPELTPVDLAPLGSPFSIKPDLGGGGWGVKTDATSWTDVETARRALPNDDFILQEFIHPARFEMGPPRRAWFRILYICGQIVPCWWDDRTRLYQGLVTQAERFAFALDPLWAITAQAAELSHLDIFSTEIALDVTRKFVVVDYVNDPVDFRLQSRAAEGMPEAAAAAAAEAIAERVRRDS